jgi:hypothetical protein
VAEVPALDATAAEERAAVEEAQELPETITLEEAEFAILIYRKPDGSLVVTPDINVPVEVERQATSDELKATLSKILDDIRAQEIANVTAQMVIANQMQFAMRAAQAQENQRLLQTLPGLAK